MRRQVGDIYEEQQETICSGGFEPHRKKRRTSIVDACKSFALTDEQYERPSFDFDASAKSRNQGLLASNNHVASVRDTFMIDAEDDDSVNSSDERPLSLIEQAERDIMRSLVYGTSANRLKELDPVERRVQELIRDSVQEASRKTTRQEPQTFEMDTERTDRYPPALYSFPDAFTREDTSMEMSPI